jgi:hypothetical protein
MWNRSAALLAYYQKPRSYSEVYNDLDGEVVNLFAYCVTLN